MDARLQDGLGFGCLMFRVIHLRQPKLAHGPAPGKESVFQKHRVAMQRHGDVTGRSQRAFGSQSLDELRALAPERVRFDAEHVKPVTAAVLGMHLVRQHAGQTGDPFRQQVAEACAFADDAFKPLQLRRRHRRLRLAHAVVRRERLEQSALHAIKSLVAGLLQQRTESFVVRADQAAVAAGDVLGVL